MSDLPHHAPHRTRFHALIRVERLFNRDLKGPYPRDSIWGVPALHEPILSGRVADGGQAVSHDAGAAGS